MLHFHPPRKDAVKNKMVSAVCLAIIIGSLYAICYLLFFRTTSIDVYKDIEITYRGEDGSATVMVKNKNLNYNQRIAEFMDTVTYQVTPNKALKNGDKVTIKASYDKTLASRYHIDLSKTETVVAVDLLPIRYESAKQIPQTFLDTINQNSQSYMEKNINMILRDDFTSFYVTSEAKLEDYKRIYRVFLNSEDDSTKDKILDIYAIRATGKVNTSNKKQNLEDKEETIYYMVTYNEVNTSQKVLNENVYGEKIILPSKEDLSKDSEFTSYIRKKYASGYTIERIE